MSTACEPPPTTAHRLPCVCRPPCPSIPDPQCIAFRYVQPPVTKSMKPPLAYCRLRDPMSDHTISRLSYQPICMTGWCPPKHKDVPDNLRPPKDTPMTVISTTQLDFPYWGWIPPRLPIKPCPRRLTDDACISDVTTSRESYQPPLIVCTEKVEHPPALKPPNVPMEGLTTMRAAYTIPACPHQRGTFKPPRCFKPCEKFEGSTVSRLSYVPWPVMPKEVFPWTKKPVWQPPEKPMCAVSLYATSYLPPGWFIKEPCVETCPAPQGPPRCEPRCVPCSGPRADHISATGVPC